MTDTRIAISDSAPAGTLELLQELVAKGMPENCRPIYSGRNIVAVTPDGSMCIKSFKVNGLVKCVIYGCFRSPKAQRAFDNATRLRAMGIDTPEPLGMALCFKSGRLTRSYYVCRYEPGYTELRDVELRPDFPEIAAALAAYMLDLHRRGVLMKDFTPGNVLFRKDSEGVHFTLVDINRMSFDVSDRELLLANFKALLNTPAGVDAVAREYARLSGVAYPEALVKRLDAIYASHQAFLARKRRLKRRLKHSS